MAWRVRLVQLLSVVVFFVFLVNNLAFGSATGLNNIPTTDIVPENVLVFQGWVNAAGSEHPQQFIGFKYGPLKDFEVGVDWKANDVTHGHAMFQAKYAFDLSDNGIWRGVVGIADLSDNRDHNGEYFPYTATSLDLTDFRLHFGYAPQQHNEAFFGGIDKTVSFLDRNLMLRADGIHINDKEDMKFSLGFLYELWPQHNGNEAPQNELSEFLNKLTKNMLLESWVSIPSNNEKEVYTIKLNYVISF